MLQYLVILLADTSVSYCHYNVAAKVPEWISRENLSKGILFAMKQNLMVQFVYPEEDLPEGYEELIESIDHIKIMPSGAAGRKYADVLVADQVDQLESVCPEAKKECVYILHACRENLSAIPGQLFPFMERLGRLNLVFTDIDQWKEADFKQYEGVLKGLAEGVKEQYRQGKNCQLNVLTDRIMLDKMNNCNAGNENITLAPDGKFYICPAFYYEGESAGNLEEGLKILNPQLYRLSYAPVCRNCDAYQCKRCIWLNRKLTLEVNTPSHEQCVVSHLERHAACDLWKDLYREGYAQKECSMKEIDYLDPIEISMEF